VKRSKKKEQELVKKRQEELPRGGIHGKYVTDPQPHEATLGTHVATQIRGSHQAQGQP
jgi:hypothetical protein